MATAAQTTDWRQEWFEIEGATYLNAAGNTPMPKVSFRAAQQALEWKKMPHHTPDAAYFELPDRVRNSIARLIGAKPDEVAVTTGASPGVAAVAYGLEWNRGDEVLTGKGEFPLQYTSWRPMEEREGIQMKVVSPRDTFITADDFIAALTPKTRMVSTSLVRFDNGARLDAERLADACHAQGTLLLLDASQCCGAIPLDVTKLGADFVVCSGYKWLLGPFGTGFFWAKSEHIEKMRPGPYYWMAMEGAHQFNSLATDRPIPVAGARRWDAAETASYFNMAAMGASLEFVLRMGAETVEAHNHRLIEFLYERLPKDRCLPASPLERAQRGPYGCFAARTPEKTAELYERLRKENIVVSLREAKIRVAPHLYNTERDIDRVISVVTA